MKKLKWEKLNNGWRVSRNDGVSLICSKFKITKKWRPAIVINLGNEIINVQGRNMDTLAEAKEEAVRTLRVIMRQIKRDLDKHVENLEL